MPASVTFETLVDSAARAAATGDWPAASGYLRQAVALQEGALGPAHPDLASTLNNLGVVSEKSGDLDEAEHCYRRAYAIVSAALPAEDPLVATSRENLSEFCAARGISVVSREPKVDVTPAAPVTSSQPVTTPSTPLRLALEASEADVTPAPSTKSAPPIGPARSRLSVGTPAPKADTTPVVPASRFPPLAGSFVAIAVVAVLMAGFAFLRRSNTTAQPSPPAPAHVMPPPTAGSAEAPKPSPPTSPIAPAASAIPPALPRPPVERPAAPEEASIVVVESRLCTALTAGAEWSCTPASDAVGPGVLYFYTRVRTPRDTVVVHRWYRDDHPELTRTLQLHANTSPGYRTYSRMTLDAQSHGTWRVEAQTASGRVLSQARFVVR